MQANYEIDDVTVMIPVDQIHVGKNIKNIRTVFPEDSIQELAQSIYADGLLNPLVVTATQDSDGTKICELVCGARRLRAAQWILANLDPDWNDGEIKCTQFNGTLEDATLLNGLENIEREQVDAVDTCAWLFHQVEECGRTQEELKERLHKSAQWVSMRITIHRKGSDGLKAAMREGFISITTAYELSKTLSHEEQDKRIKKARAFGEKLTAAQVQNEDDTGKVLKPSKKRLGSVLAMATKAAQDTKKRNAFGVAIALRFVFGEVTEEDIVLAIQSEEAFVPADVPDADDGDSDEE